MSEKRFSVRLRSECDGVVYSFFDGDKPIDVDMIVDLLNEQQATINKLQDLCGESDGENAKLRLKNKELQEEIKLLKPVNIEQYEQIVQLQEENKQLNLAIDDLLTHTSCDEIKKQNEQLRSINKEIGDDLHNCRINKNIIKDKLKRWQDVHKEYDIYNIKDFEELMKKVK